MEKSVCIKLNSDSKAILKTGFIFRAAFFGVLVFGVCSLGLSVFAENKLMAVFCFAIGFGLILVIYRMLGAAFQTEELELNETELVIIQKGIHVNTREVVKLDTIRQIGFSDTAYTPNPMDNKIVDFTGLGAQEREMQFVIDEGNIVIETETKTFRFGKKLPTWEVDSIIEQIEEISGRKFQRIVLPETPALTNLSTEEDAETNADV